LGLEFPGDVGAREKKIGPFVTPGSHLLQFNSKDFSELKWILYGFTKFQQFTGF
jgi:hypothetical protein